MSVHIVDEAYAVVIPKEVTGNFEDAFCLLEQGGDNNVFESGTRQRARSWCCVAIGEDHQVMTRVVELAAGCCGGGMRINGRPGTQPETYIRWWRTALKQVHTPAQARADGFSLSFHVTIPFADAREHQWVAERCMRGLVREPEIRPYFDDDRAMVWPINPDDAHQLRIWLGALLPCAWHRLTARNFRRS